MGYSRHLFGWVIALLLFSAAVMFVQAYRTAQNEQEYHTTVLERAVHSTAREIELSVKSAQRALRIFAEQERIELARIVSSPLQVFDDKGIARQIALYFPNHLAFAVSDPLARTPVASDLSLFGQHCRQNLHAYTSIGDRFPLVPAIHDAGRVDSEHFDIMARIPDEGLTGKTIGVLFLSFKMGDLERLLENGSSGTHSLALEDLRSKRGQAGSNLLGQGAIEEPGTEQPDQFLAPDESLVIEGTTWMLKGWLNPDTTARGRNASLNQTAAGSLALLVAGLTAWRSVQQERVSRNRAAIVLNSVEAERKRIARDLHDQVLSDVNHTKRLLADIDLDSDDNNHATGLMIQQVQCSIDDFSSGIRTAIEDLHPHTLENLGLCKAIEAHAHARCAAGPTLEHRIADTVDAAVRPEQQLQLYRITAEVIDNALRHSQCRKIELSLNTIGDNVILRIADNGIGFDPELKTKPGRHGLVNIESRSASLGARIQWTRRDLGGTCFELELPINTHDIS